MMWINWNFHMLPVGNKNIAFNLENSLAILQMIE